MYTFKQYQCYCHTREGCHKGFLKCEECEKLFHLECLKTGNPAVLEGDTFFKLVCDNCGRNGEKVTRLKPSWLQIVMLVLFNLQLKGSGKKGYFHWKEHVASFLSKHWNLFFDTTRKKSNSWHGTVAGTLSSGCPEYFCSGARELREPGWWKLMENKPPTIHSRPRQRQITETVTESNERTEGLRKRKYTGNSLEAAVKLKEERATTKERKEIMKTKHKTSTKVTKAEDPISETVKSSTSSLISLNIDSLPGDSQQSFGSRHSSESYFTEKDLWTGDVLPDVLLKDDSMDEDSDFEIDPGSHDITDSYQLPTDDSTPQVEDILATLETSVSVPPTDTTVVKQEKHEEDITDESDTSETEPSSSESEEEHAEETPGEKKHRKIVTGEDKVEEPPPINYTPVSLHDERKLFKRLLILSEKMHLPTKLNRLKRKLAVRSLKRERGLPIFDIDASIQSALGKTDMHYHQQLFLNQDYRVLDRFQSPSFSLKMYQQQPVSFLNRLIGSEDDQLQSICSPYTERILKPFIRRDYESLPLKLKLLQEIVAFFHRNDPTWKTPVRAPIDYCYVRPQHIPSINTLCREFFWPGIDLSECLQYPDFSCVVLYRKVVIGFAFMVPDVKYNEAYISFIFTHPEWRAAGIASFVLYHLIQTCMGKDVTLHVSATNTAMLLYQKFGFKPEEYILDFYDKYYPENSQECKHAFFMRLKR